MLFISHYRSWFIK